MVTNKKELVCHFHICTEIWLVFCFDMLCSITKVYIYNIYAYKSSFTFIYIFIIKMGHDI